MQRAFNTYAVSGGAQIWVLDQQPDGSTPIDGNPENYFVRTPHGMRGWQPGDPVPTRVLMDYQAGVAAAVNDPARFRIADMDDVDHAELLADAEARRPALDAQNKAILRTRGIAAALIAALAVFWFAPCTVVAGEGRDRGHGGRQI